jgi:hypothetical protein
VCVVESVCHFSRIGTQQYAGGKSHPRQQHPNICTLHDAGAQPVISASSRISSRAVENPVAERACLRANSISVVGTVRGALAESLSIAPVRNPG